MGDIITIMRAKNTSFQGNVFGSAELDVVLKNTDKLGSVTHAAFLVDTGDQGLRNQLDNGLQQEIIEHFSVITAIRNDQSKVDDLGMTAYNDKHDIRAELFKMFIGRYFRNKDSENLSQVWYEGSKLVGLDNGYLWYQYNFAYSSEIRHYIVEVKPGDEDVFLDGYDPEIYDIDELLRIHSQLIITPSFELTQLLNETQDNPNLPVDSNITHSEQNIDDTDNPNRGAFWFGFNPSFNKYKE